MRGDRGSSAGLAVVKQSQARPDDEFGSRRMTARSSAGMAGAAMLEWGRRGPLRLARAGARHAMTRLALTAVIGLLTLTAATPALGQKRVKGPDLGEKQRDLRETQKRLGEERAKAADARKREAGLLAELETIDRRLTEEEFEAQMILQVHDELLFEAPAKEQAKLQKLVKEEMEGVYKLAVPIIVEIGVGPNWRDLD